MSAFKEAGNERAICLRARAESSQMRTGKDMHTPTTNRVANKFSVTDAQIIEGPEHQKIPDL
ncbi:hypothetical protein GCM10007938_16220 [Vibrio zhanjiangensis]|uniref:Uncharacterized protein n=1 Tax=Vibrio zhanjiangensis TaxID=1046128 RepID=A0ABQ6EXY3_9VIBR|nr:hypothetical protein GCM10007938_16220 [Vibrio zhanjiangensis]